MTVEGRPPADVSIVVPTYRRPGILHETLRALLGLDGSGAAIEVLVVDDGHDAASAEVVTALQRPGVRLEYHRPQGKGAAAARNHGARLARHAILLFVDDDIILKPDSLTRDRRALERFAPCAVNARWEFAPELLNNLQSTPFGRYRIEVEKWVKARLHKAPVADRYLEAEGLTACNLALLREVFGRLGGFDESFPHA